MFDRVEAEHGNELFDACQIKRLMSAHERIRWTFGTGACSDF